MISRLDFMKELLLPTETLADIGCDHGKFGVAVLEAKKAQHVIFSDISIKSLEKAERLCEKKKILNAEFLCTNGCDGMRYANTIVIAGMGGKEIISILERCQHYPRQLILQPMKNQKELREYLQNHFYTEIDLTIFDNKFYTVIRCSSGKEELSELQLQFGKTNLIKPTEDFIKFLNKELEKTNTLMQNATKSSKVVEYNRLIKTCKGEICQKN